MKNLTVIFLLAISILGFSQEAYNSESYRVTLGDIESSTFAKDSTANAIVIYEEGKSYVDKNNYNLRTEEKYKIKILKREGFDNASVNIYLYNNKSTSEKVEKIIATTYNKVGDEVIKTQLDAKNIFEEKYDENRTLVKFTLPNIKEGSVITYSYTTISRFMAKYHGWDFQGEIPKLYSEYNPSIPANWEYNIKLVGGQKLAINETEVEKNCLVAGNGGISNCFNARYAMKDIPAFIEEDYMTSKSNYLIRVDYDLKTFRGFDGRISDYTKSWETVDKELKTDLHIGKQLKKSVDTEELLSTDIINEIDLLKKAKAIYTYIQDNYTWDEEYRLFSKTSVKDLIKNKSGNAASINILLHNLLEESNIDVKPVLISTRGNGLATKIYPVLYDFNYLVVQVTLDNKTYLLDATDDYLTFGQIPFRCLNQYGRLLDFKNGSEWLDIKPNEASNIYYNTELKFNENQIITGNISSKRTGYHALTNKKKYYQNTDAYIDKLENNYPYLEISDFEVTSNGKTSNDYEETYNLQYNYENTGDNIYLNPFFVKFFNENPFKLQERTYPIDFGYEDTYLYLFKLRVSDNYSVEEMPENINLTIPNNAGQLLFSTNTIGNTINLLLKITFKKAIYEPEYYPYLKEFFNKVVDIQKNSLILLKKK